MEGFKGFRRGQRLRRLMGRCLRPDWPRGLDLTGPFSLLKACRQIHRTVHRAVASSVHIGRDTEQCSKRKAAWRPEFIRWNFSAHSKKTSSRLN